MRITGGRHRGRRLAAPRGSDLRPTSDRVRESLFNILAHGRHGGDLAGAAVLDAFAGTGALGLEALSRGAAHATFMDIDRAALAGIERTLAVLDEDERASVLRADATRPPTPGASVAIAFLDPPYLSGLAHAAMVALAAAGWFAPGALVVVETEAGEDLTLPPGMELVDDRRYGGTRIMFLRWSSQHHRKPD